MAKHYLALDLGAESGRAIVGTLDGERLTLDEVHRFPNAACSLQGRLVWNVLSLWEQMKVGLRLAATRSPLSGIGVATWGVDFGLLDANGRLIGFPTMYRDPAAGPAFEAAIRDVPRREIYEATGISLMSINTLYQLLARRDRDDAELKSAAWLLMMPDLFNALLSGVTRAETSIASTSQLYDPRSRTWATTVIKRFGLSTSLLPPLVPSGTVLGKLLPDVANECGISGAPDVIAVAGHDTASAVVAVPAEGDDWCYLSSGTWSLLGVELPAPIITNEAMAFGFTNEAGADGTTRLLKNRNGMWLVQECRRQFARDGHEHTYAELMEMADACEPFRSLVDPSSPVFSQPGDFPRKIAEACRATGQPVPASRGEFVRACLDSLAFAYRQTLAQLEQLLGRRLKTIHVVGGGARNELLNQLTADVCGREVSAGPFEATAAGNVIVQAIATGDLTSIADGRRIVRNSFEMERYSPRPIADLDHFEQRFAVLSANA